MRGSGIEPHIENVGFLAPTATRRRNIACPRASNSSTGCVNHASAPSTREPLLHQRVQRCIIVKLFAALVAIQNHQRHAPETLPRNAPVRPLRNHRMNPLGAPLGRPFHFRNFRERARTDRRRAIAPRAVQIDEPLFGGAKNYGIVAAPAMRIAVRKFLFAKQRAAIAQQRSQRSDSPRIQFCLCTPAGPRDSGRGHRSARTPRCHISARSGNPRRHGPARCARCRFLDRA